MNYLLKKSFQRFWKNRKKYAFIILQLTAGTCMMALAFHIRFSFQEQFRTFQKEIDSQYINIMANDKGGRNRTADFLRLYIYQGAFKPGWKRHGLL